MRGASPRGWGASLSSGLHRGVEGRQGAQEQRPGWRPNLLLTSRPPRTYGQLPGSCFPSAERRVLSLLMVPTCH